MKKFRLLSVLLFSIVLFCMSLLIFSSVYGSVSARDIYVDDDQVYPEDATGAWNNPYRYIQDAIDVAQDGDTITILAGEYKGDIVIDKSISIRTENVETTIINSSTKNPYVIDVVADSVSIEGLSIKDLTNTSHRKAVIHVSPDTSNARIINNFINCSRNGYGIFLDGSNNGILKNNTINNVRTGIYVGYSNVVTIDNNKIYNCSNNGGIQITSSYNDYIIDNHLENNTYGIYGSSCSGTTFQNNTIVFNDKTGIVITSGTKNKLLNNTIKGNKVNGISLDGDEAEITGNDIGGNDGLGISIGGSSNVLKDNHIYGAGSYGLYAMSGSKDNLIYNNTFENNSNYNAKEDGSNHWYNEDVGNYWDDFYGPDPNSKSNTCDPAAFRYLKGGVADFHPLGKYRQEPIIVSNYPEDLAEGVKRSPILKVEVNDPNPEPYKDRLDVDFYYLDSDGTSHKIGSSYDVESGTEASVLFSSLAEGKTGAYSYGGLGYDFICQWYAVVKDEYSAIHSPVWTFSTMNPPVDNERPTAIISAQKGVMVGNEIHAELNEAIYFDGSGCVDSDGKIVFYRWSFGDDKSVVNVQSPSHSYEREGTYTVSLVVIDDDGASNTTTKIVQIGAEVNKAPIAVASGPSSAYTGETIQFKSTGSYDPNPEDASTLNYTWNFGDGTKSYDKDPQHVFASKGTFQVTLTLTDQVGNTGTSKVSVTVSSKEKNTPGFELLIFIAAAMILLIKKRKLSKL